MCRRSEACATKGISRMGRGPQQLLRDVRRWLEEQMAPAATSSSRSTGRAPSRCARCSEGGRGVHPAALRRGTRAPPARPGTDSEDVIPPVLGARGEMRHVAEFDYVIINEDLPAAIEDLVAVVSGIPAPPRQPGGAPAGVFPLSGNRIDPWPVLPSTTVSKNPQPLPAHPGGDLPCPSADGRCHPRSSSTATTRTNPPSSPARDRRRQGRGRSPQPRSGLRPARQSGNVMDPPHRFPSVVAAFSDPPPSVLPLDFRATEGAGRPSPPEDLAASKPPTTSPPTPTRAVRKSGEPPSPIRSPSPRSPPAGIWTPRPCAPPSSTT